MQRSNLKFHGAPNVAGGETVGRCVSSGRVSDRSCKCVYWMPPAKRMKGRSCVDRHASYKAFDALPDDGSRANLYRFAP